MKFPQIEQENNNKKNFSLKQERQILAFKVYSTQTKNGDSYQCFLLKNTTLQYISLIENDTLKREKACPVRILDVVNQLKCISILANLMILNPRSFNFGSQMFSLF